MFTSIGKGDPYISPKFVINRYLYISVCFLRALSTINVDTKAKDRTAVFSRKQRKQKYHFTAFARKTKVSSDHVRFQENTKASCDYCKGKGTYDHVPFGVSTSLDIK